MRLNEARITDFRCIEDSDPFSVGQVTCLVGKNESGKTAILHALAKVNSADPNLATLDVEHDYPRSKLTEYGESTKVVETKWILDTQDIAVVEKTLGPGSLSSDRFTHTKRYDSHDTWDLQLNESAVVQWLLSQSGCDANDRQQLGECATVRQLLAKAESLKAGSPRIAKLVERTNTWSDKDPTRAAAAVLHARMPKFLYFSSYDRMNGNVALEQLRQAVNANAPSRSDLVFLAFLESAGLSLQDLEKLDRYERLKARVEAASINVSKQMFKYWSQNRHLKVQFSLEAGRSADPPPFNSGNIMRTRIYDTLHEMTLPFDDRSAGFVWFFSFLVLFSQVKKQHGNVILLLDEPGLSLHAKAQADLLRFINEELKPHHQVLYTAHSPFMVPADDLPSVRTVEDVVRLNPDGAVAEVRGTKVGDHVLSTDTETLLPVQAALGYEITQSLFVGKHNLIVESPADVLYLQVVSGELARHGRAKKDSRWTICPAGAVDKVAAFLSLFGGDKLHVAVLLHYAQGRQAKIDWLRKSRLLADGHVLATIDFCNQREADLEDFFGPDLYVELVNEAYGLKVPEKLAVAEVNAAPETSPRILKKVEAVWRLRPKLPDFDHYVPATWLVQNPKWLLKGDLNRAACLDRFEGLFKRLNALLVPP